MIIVTLAISKSVFSNNKIDGNIYIMMPNVAIFVLIISSLASLIMIILRFDPFVVGRGIKVLFFVSLILFLSGTTILIFRNLMVNIKKRKEEKSIEDFS